MSHELRTPLNSMLILAKLLSDNSSGNLTPKQAEFANTIYGSGGDLLNLINEILDLSKVEAGKMEIDITHVAVAEVQEYVERTFDHVARQKGLGFHVEIEPDAPVIIQTDMQRLQQVLRNLLSNAFKFTEQGRVDLTIAGSDRDVILDNGQLFPARQLVAFCVTDTGIGIPRDKQSLIFEAFQQADGTTNRRYGGTGLGLSISREITRLLGGRIQVDSTPGRGSTFTLYLPLDYTGSAATATAGSSNGRHEVGLSPAGGQIGYAASARSQGWAPAPITRKAPEAPLPTVHRLSPLPEVRDDRAAIEPGDRVLLIVEDDVNFAGILLDMVRQQGFKGLVAPSGEKGLELARRFKPDAITLDLKLSGMDGWALLDHLKRDPDTRHIPVQVISVMDRERGLTLGAISYLEKPVSPEALEGAFAHIKNFIDRDVKELLVVEDNEVQRAHIVELVGNGDVVTTAVGTGEEALAALKNKDFDCMVLDLTLPDREGFELLREVKAQPKFQDLPVVIYTSKDLSRQEEAELKKYAATIITKDATSSERLLDDTALFLHRVVSKMPEAKRKIVEQRHPSDSDGGGNGAAATEAAAPLTDAATRSKKRAGSTPAAARTGRKNAAETGNEAKGDTGAVGAGGVPGDMTGRTVLVVDDDMRNIFALTSMLESHGFNVLFAENGKTGIDILMQTPTVDVVLMDVMMPEMDGYETMEIIRRMERFENLPIIALTAKAMTGDREKCLAAGASDYIPKPVDTEHLLVMLGQWLGRLA